jgi:hypothetical protein
MNLENIFSEAFDTFKVFSELTVEQVNNELANAPQSIWQILNHLFLFQQHQLNLLHGDTSRGQEFDEQLTWIENRHVQDQTQLDHLINGIENQLTSVKQQLGRLSPNDNDFETKTKIVIDFSLHLSFHLGETVLLRRLNRDYPLPHQMKEFLMDE